MRLRPPRLQTNQTFGIIAPASAPPDPKMLDRAVAALHQMGFQTRLGRHIQQRRGYLAGTDRERASDLMRMFTDRNVDAILCMRGGYGAARLLPRLDFQTIRAHPKIFVGYSDITSLHCALLTQANLISFHGPMLNSDFAHADMPEFTWRSFLRMLTEQRAAGSIVAGYQLKSVKVLRRGVARGPLIGGNLSVLCTTIATPWQPPFRNCVLFLEDVREEPYRFDRMLTHFLNCGLLQQVAGIAIGLNSRCEDPKLKTAKEYRQTLEDVLKDRLLPLKIPVVTGLPFGHTPHNATLALGVNVVLDANYGDLIFSEPAVS